MEKRIYLFDNLKFFLIICVVIGHFIDPVIEKSVVFQNLFIFIYLFHMPLFIFISGYFSKSFYKDGHIKLYKLIQLMILYILLQLGEILTYYLLTGTILNRSFFITNGIPWYLLAIVIWSMTIPIIQSIKPKYMMMGSILLGIFIGTDSFVTDFLALSRVFVFYPFFLAGYYLSKENLQKILNRENTIFAILILLILFFIIFNSDFHMYSFRLLLTGRNPYKVAGFRLSIGCFYRLFYYGIVFLVIGSLIHLAPRKKHFYSTLGSRTLQVYFLHDFIYIILQNSSFYSWIIKHIPYWKIFLLIFAVGIAITLSLKIFEYPFQLLSKQKFHFLNKKTTP